jgi:hypothetical protein
VKTLILWLSVGLMFGLTLSPTRGQPHPPAAIGAGEHEPSGQRREVASDIPVDDLDRGTPHRALAGFDQAAPARHYQRAVDAIAKMWKNGVNVARFVERLSLRSQSVL